MAEEERILEVTPDFDGKRIDQCLAASFSDCSRSFLQKLLKDGKVSINGKTQKASSKVAAGDAVLVLLPEPEARFLGAGSCALLSVSVWMRFFLTVPMYKRMMIFWSSISPRGWSYIRRQATATEHWSMRFCITAAEISPASTAFCAPESSTESIWTQRVPWLSVRAISPTRASQNSSLYIPLPESTGQLSMGI